MTTFNSVLTGISWRNPAVASAAALVAIVLVVGVIAMPAELYPGDPMTMREETRAILLHGELAVSDAVAENYLRVGERGQYVVDNPRTGRAYSKYGTMTAVFYLIPMAVELFVEGSLPSFDSRHRLLYLNAFNIALSCLVALSLHRTARRFGAGPWTATAFVLSCFYTTFLWNYLRAQNSEIMQLLLFAWAVTAFLDALDDREGRATRWPVARLWLACTALLLTKASYLVVGPLFALALVVHRQQAQQISWPAAFWREGLLHALPALGCVAAWAGINWIKFGAPWLTGYHVWRTDITAPFAGDLGKALYELACSARWGLPYLFPILLLAVPWVRSWIGRHTVAYGAILGIAAFHTVLVGSLISWRGEMAYGPRYWLFVIPFVALPATEAPRWLARRSAARLVMAACVVGVLGHSLLNQMAVNRHSFFAAYNLSAPLDNVLGIEAAEFFLGSSDGDIIRAFESEFPELTWWENMQPRIHPDAARAYEKHVGAVLAIRNLYWFR